MPYIDPEVILEAKQMDLLTYLQAYEPHELVHFSGSTYCTRSHDSLKISNGKWFWWSRGIGGKSALDYLIKVRELSFTDAVEQIMGRAASTPPVFVPRQKQEPKALLLPAPYPYTDEVERYLLRRGIDRRLIHACIADGRIYGSHNESEPGGKIYINAVFVGFDAQGQRKYAALRGINGDFKGEATGSDKHYSFAIPALEPSDAVHLFESAVDLLSFATLMKMSGKDYTTENLLSLAGVYQPQKNISKSKVPAALTRFLEDNLQVQNVLLHLDNDYAGRMATKAIMTVLPKKYEAADRPPPACKDINAYLCKKLHLPEKAMATSKEKTR
jgi:hypothetical protein